MVVASNPDVISWGATKPNPDEMSRYCCVALIGRASVWVTGEVEVGDHIQVRAIDSECFGEPNE